jgi:hypothetical protein
MCGLLCFDRFTARAFLSSKDPRVTTAIVPHQGDGQSGSTVTNSILKREGDHTRSGANDSSNPGYCTSTATSIQSYGNDRESSLAGGSTQDRSLDPPGW